MVAEGESMEREKDGQFTVFDKAEWEKKSWKEANEGNTKGRLELILMNAHITTGLSIFRPIVPLLWSKSGDEFVNL